MVNSEPSYAFRPWAEQRAVQLQRLRKQVLYALKNSPYYRQRFGTIRVPDDPSDLPAFLATIPPTTRNELQQHNDQLTACAPDAVRDIICTSGTTGKPIALPLTENDLDRLSVTEFYTCEAAGIQPGDTVLLCVTLDALFMAGMAYYLGLKRRRCRILRQGAGNPAAQLERIRRFNVSAIVTVPSFLLALTQEAKRQGLTSETFPLRKAILVGDTLRNRDLTPNPTARRIRELYPVELYGNYGNSEMSGSFCECSAGRGNHIHPDLVYSEILREDGSPVADGEEGFLAVTPLQLEGAPLLRYLTGDVTFQISDPCACGRLSPRIGPILARRDQMLKIRGTKIYPAAVRDVISSFPFIKRCVLIADDCDFSGEKLSVLAELDDPAERDAELSALNEHLADTFRVRIEVAAGDPAEITALISPPGYRKKRWFADRRKGCA
jgi:phenylacetate-CoA ligase